MESIDGYDDWKAQHMDVCVFDFQLCCGEPVAAGGPCEICAGGADYETKGQVDQERRTTASVIGCGLLEKRNLA